MRARRFLRNSLFGLLLASCGSGTSEIPYYDSADFTPMFLNPVEADTGIRHRIPEFSLIDENGNPFSNRNLSGKIHVADFIFTSCGSICPKMTDRMKLVADAFRNDSLLNIVSYSVTPWIDSPQVLREYKKSKGITSNNWHFLTGDKAVIYDLARKGYFAEERLGFTKDSTEFLHTEHFILVDADGRIRGIYNGTLELEAQQLIADIRKIENER